MRVLLNQKILIIFFVLATVLMFGVVRAEEAGFSTSVDGGVLTVTNDQKGEVFINCSGEQVKVNGKDPQTGAASCASIITIIVNGGSDADNINLSGVTTGDFANLTSVTVNGNIGNDVITASSFSDTLYGGPGDDVFMGTQADDFVDTGPGQDFFVDVPEPSIAPVGFIANPMIVDEPQIPLAPGLLTTIEGLNYGQNGNTGGWRFIPPDPIGAAGPNHVVSVDNVSIEFYQKGGTRDYSNSLQTFFAPLTPVNYTFDPKVIYDQYENRFVVVTLERQDTANGDPVNSSRILVAVSDDSDPNGTWYFTSINSTIMIGGSPRWADYPGFAVDDQVVYITNNMFGFGGGAFAGVRLWIMDKGVAGGFYAGSPAAVTRYDPYGGGGTATTTQPTHMFGQIPTNMGTFLVSHSGLSSGGPTGVEFVQSVRVDNPLGSPTFTQQYINVGNIDDIGTQPNAPQIGSTGGITEIWTNNRRALHSVWRDNFLWMSATIVPNSGVDLGQATAHWFKLDTSTLASLSLNDQGNVGGEDIHPSGGVHTFFPSLAVDPCGNMAIGFAASSANIYAGAYYTGRNASDTPGTVQSTGTLAAGVAYYQRTFGGSRNRWGDYSGMSLDPSDDATFWVYNEYAITRGEGTTPEDGRWGTRFGSFQLHTNGFDFGDLPPSYNVTNRGVDGPRHCVGSLYLGSVIDSDADGQETSASDGDDTDGTDDEEGVFYANTPWSDGTNGASVNVTIGGSGTGCLNGWLDWNMDGSFDDADEHIINNASVTAGTSPTYSFNVPSGTFPGSGLNRTFNARFRLFDSCPLTPATAYVGTSSNGEVEDYQWGFYPTAISIRNFDAQTFTLNYLAWIAGFVLITLIITALVWQNRRRKNSS